MDFKYLFTATRARVYLLWAILVPIGFIATQYHQQHNINNLWVVLSLIGLGYMYKVMFLKLRQMRRIFLAWLIPIATGIIITGGAFYVHADLAFQLIGHLGAFWLVVMAIGYTWNGIVDPPGGWYFFNAGLNLAAAALCYFVIDFEIYQFLMAAAISFWSMVNLWLFRSGAF